MKKLVDLELKDILAFVLNSKKLSEKLGNYITDMCYGSIAKKISKSKSLNYSYVVFGTSYVSIGDYRLFLDDMKSYVKQYSCSESFEKLLKQTNDLFNSKSNLANHFMDKLCAKFYEEEIKPELDYAESMIESVWNKRFTNSDLINYMEFFTNEIENVYLDDEEKPFEINYL